MPSGTPSKPQLSAANQGSRPCDLTAAFKAPPATFGPVPFYWWAGEPLDRERMAWQLDKLREKGVRRTVVSYPHHPDGSNNAGDPPLFSSEWWDYFRWFLDACRERGMTAGFQDYTLVHPILEAIGRETPGMQGGEMGSVSRRISGESEVRLIAEPGTMVIGAWAYPLHEGTPLAEGRIPLGNCVTDGELVWNAPSGDWFVSMVFARLCPFDPMHPEAGPRAIERLYSPFERECPDHFGTTLDLFFQDELDFGGRMPFWSSQLFEAFAARKGYDLYPLLPALWHDMGKATEKIRLDYADTVSARIEECYFKPIFRWHEERGTLFGHDNSGRGDIAAGRSHYGDYFRAMRWFSAPGCDDPNIHGARAFKGLKVNSSIAQLYERPRVWVEAFHSSGWGTAPADVLSAIREDFAYGATVVNLHGLYYSTRGGWWEWAPPDFHFRQPYWEHSQAMNGYLTRLCWILAQGRHRCDVAMVYPIASLDAEPADPIFSKTVAHIGNSSLGGLENSDARADESAFRLGKSLFDHACDFDFIDFESIARAMCAEGKLQIAGGSYRVLLMPGMATVHFSTLLKARDFVRAGGVVIAYGRLPKASDHAGREDAELDGLLGEIFGSADDSVNLEKSHHGGGRAFFIRQGYPEVLEVITASVSRDVVSSVPLQALHRHLGDREVFYLFNPADHPVEARIRFRDTGSVEIWDAWTGQCEPVPSTEAMKFAAREARLLVMDTGKQPAASNGSMVEKRTEMAATLDGAWDFELVPCLDNRFGDFSLPASTALLGAQARRFRYMDDMGSGEAWHTAGFDDSSWPETTFSYGPQMEFIGPFPPDSDLLKIERDLLGGLGEFDWQPYSFSRRWGIERDPFLTHWLSGPHGLKGAVPDEYLDFHSETPGSVWFVRARILSPDEGETLIQSSARCAHQVWVNGHSILCRDKPLPPGSYAPWGIPHYEAEAEGADVRLNKGENELFIKLTQPEGQRTRACILLDPPQEDHQQPALRGFSSPDALRPCLLAAPERRGIRFRFSSPPGFREMTFATRGAATAWADGNALDMQLVGVDADGLHHYRASTEHERADPVIIALKVNAPRDSHAGDAIPEPVCFTCGKGRITPGDWCSRGLSTFSGTAIYSRSFETAGQNARISLDLGHVGATAAVRVNGKHVATLLCPPWTCDITDFVVPGKNELSVTVANTLANHYSVGIPSPYAFESQTPSGLFGPVTIQHST